MKPTQTIAHRSDHYAFHQWFYASCITLLTLCTCLTIITIRQYWSYKLIMQSYDQLSASSDQLSACLTEKRELKKQTGLLKDRLAKFKRIAYKPKNPARILRLLQQTPSDVQIYRIEIVKKSATLQVYSSHASPIMNHAQDMQSEANIVDVSIASIEHCDGLVKAMLIIQLA